MQLSVDSRLEGEEDYAHVFELREFYPLKDRRVLFEDGSHYRLFVVRETEICDLHEKEDCLICSDPLAEFELFAHQVPDNAICGTVPTYDLDDMAIPYSSSDVGEEWQDEEDIMIEVAYCCFIPVVSV